MIFVGASDGHLYGFVESRPPSQGNRTASREDWVPHAGFFAFLPPRPNPSSSSVRFEWVLPERSPVAVGVYDIQGREVCRVVDEAQEPGEHFAVWDGRDETGREIASGVYFARIVAGVRSGVWKLVHLRGL